MFPLNQRSPAYKDVMLGKSPYSINKYGCLTCALSYLSQYFHCYIDPVECATKTFQYTKDGLLLWPSIDFLPHMKFVRRYYSRDDKIITEALKNPDTAVVLQVNGNHWLAAIKPSFWTFKKSYVCQDPWMGDYCDVIRRYKNITGFAVVKVK